MAFNPNNLSMKRTSFISPDKVISNLYFSEDTFEEVAAPDYFPAYFGFDDNFVIINDCIRIVSLPEKSIKEYLVMSVNPLVLSPVSAIGETFYIDADTSGAVVTTLPLLFYKNNMNMRFLCIPGSPGFTITSSGTIDLQNINIPPDFIPSYNININMNATSSGNPILINFTISTVFPFISMTNQFTEGELIAINNAYSVY